MRQIRQRLLNAAAIRQDRAVALRRTTLRTETYSLGAVRLYREDLQAIAKAAAELGALRIETDDFASDDPADFAQLPAKLTELRISAEKADSDTKLVIELSPKNATVTVTEPDTLASGIRARVQEICRTRLRPLRRRPSVAPMPASGAGRHLSTLAADGLVPFLVLVGATGAVLGSLQTLDKNPVFQAIAILTALTIPAGSVLVTFITKKSAILVNAYSADRPTFFQRKRDDIVISVVSFAAGGVLGYFVNQIS